MKSIFTSEYRVVLKKLVAARKTAGVTQSQLARKLRKPQSFVSKIERLERRLDVVEFVNVCKALSVAPYEILADIILETTPKANREKR